MFPLQVEDYIQQVINIIKNKKHIFTQVLRKDDMCCVNYHMILSTTRPTVTSNLLIPITPHARRANFFVHVDLKIVLMFLHKALVNH